jgi:hypothetical protein
LIRALKAWSIKRFQHHIQRFEHQIITKFYHFSN